MADKVTYFWSGSNHPGEIAALADNGRDLGVTINELDKKGRAMEQLFRLADFHVTLGVTRNQSGKPIIMFNRGRGTCAKLPQGDTLVKVNGERIMVGFRKVACNVARKLNDTANIMGDMLKGMFGDDAGEAGAGHHVVLKLTRAGWEMTPEELAELDESGVDSFIDSGAFSEVEFTEHGPVTVKPIKHDDYKLTLPNGRKETIPGWSTRLAGMTKIASVLRNRAYLVAPDKVGDQDETFKRLKRYASHVRKWREMGANVIVVLQRGKLSALEFDAKCSEILGFDDYVRGIPSKKAAATPEEIGELVSGLPLGTRVHLLGLSPFGDNYEPVMAQIPEGYPLFCDSVRIRALVGRNNGPNDGPRILTILRDQVMSELGITPPKSGRLPALEGFLVKYKALCRYFETQEVIA